MLLILRHLPFSFGIEEVSKAIEKRLRSHASEGGTVPKVRVESKNKGHCILSIEESDVSRVTSALENWKLEGRMIAIEQNNGDFVKGEAAKERRKGKYNTINDHLSQDKGEKQG